MAIEMNSNRRIARNTLMLYCRTLIVMLVSLYTSRIVLNALGVNDYGIHNVVAGFVSLFSAISGAMSFAISRFLTFELGKGNSEQINKVFCTSIIILIVISLCIAIACEIGGLWFVHNKLNIEASRINAAVWVLQSSLFSFCVSQLSVPYNALIIAHERMNIFAYISVTDALLKLGVCFSILILPYDKLIAYSVLNAIVAMLIRILYGVYCRRNFPESKFRPILDKELIKEMGQFSGWSFIMHSMYVINIHGVNIIMNLYFGVALNAARGIAVQVQNAITQFVTGFTTAVNPQITKSYAQGKSIEMNLLICRGAKFGYYLLLILSLPVIFETDYILNIWLVDVPPHTADFIRLTILCAMVDRMGDTWTTAVRANGNLKKFTLLITAVTTFIFPLTWLAFYLGCKPEIAYVIFIVIYCVVLYVRILIAKELVGFPIKTFLKEVLFRISICTVLSIIVPLIVIYLYMPSFYRLCMTFIVGGMWTIICIMISGLSKTETRYVMAYIDQKVNFLK